MPTCCLYIYWFHHVSCNKLAQAGLWFKQPDFADKPSFVPLHSGGRHGRCLLPRVRIRLKPVSFGSNKFCLCINDTFLFGAQGIWYCQSWPRADPATLLPPLPGTGAGGRPRENVIFLKVTCVQSSTKNLSWTFSNLHVATVHTTYSQAY